MTISLTPDAESRLDQYLLRVRRSVRGTALEPEGIDRDIRAHVEQALEGTVQPVTRPTLERVLDRLGEPHQWVPEEELPPLRRLGMALTHGPEDWRLPYLAFGLTLLGVILFPVGGPLLIVAAFALSRAAIDHAETHNIDMTARRWLLYPALVFCLIPLAALVLAGPVIGAGAWWIGERGYAAFYRGDHDLQRIEQVCIYGGFMLLAAGVWLMIVSSLVVALRRVVLAVAYPIVREVRGRYAVIAAITGALIATLGGVLMTML
jgi:hypothetical protein